SPTPRSSTMLRLDVFKNSNNTPSRSSRSGSPSGASTLITSAPASASNFEQYAPGIPVERSTTRRPVRGWSWSTKRSVEQQAQKRSVEQQAQHGAYSA